MNRRRFAPGHISALSPHEIFVFGSDLASMHGGGVVCVAHGEVFREVTDTFYEGRRDGRTLGMFKGTEK